MENLVFDSLDLKEIPVKLGSRTFMLREATSEAYCRRQAAINSARVYNDAGVQIGWKGLSDTEPLTVSLCILEVTDGGYTAVELSEIKTWPRRIVEQLSDKILEMSGMLVKVTKEELLKQKADIEKELEKLETDTAKNLPSS